MKTHRLDLLSLLVWALAVAGIAAEPTKPAKPARAPRAVDPVFAPVADQPGLPRVLLIGDSISIGYTLDVRERLQGKANVHRIPTNGGPTTHGLSNLSVWLGTSKWDVIHFNWGLHDLKYVGATGDTLVAVGAPGSRRQVSPEDYEANLRKLLVPLKATGARLIWCATTPVPEGAKGRTPGDEVRYNEVAARVMREAGVAVDDLYTHAAARLREIQKRADVHYTPEGSRYLGAKVAAEILAALP